MQQQTIENVKLRLQSVNGIKPLARYNGVGRLVANSTGFEFRERVPQPRRVVHVRIAHTERATMYINKESGKYRFVIDLEDFEVNDETLVNEIRNLRKEAEK